MCLPAEVNARIYFFLWLQFDSFCSDVPDKNLVFTMFFLFSLAQFVYICWRFCCLIYICTFILLISNMGWNNSENISSAYVVLSLKPEMCAYVGCFDSHHRVRISTICFPRVSLIKIFDTISNSSHAEFFCLLLHRIYPISIITIRCLFIKISPKMVLNTAISYVA